MDYKKINFRKNPKLYSMGKGEQGVLMVEPYKSEILPFWNFKTPEIAEKSARKIYHLFQTYKRQGDFVGMVAKDLFYKTSTFCGGFYIMPRVRS